MEEQTISIIHFEDNPSDAILVREFLADAKNIRFRIIHTDHLLKGLKMLSSMKVDMIILDLNLPDSHGYKTFEAVKQAAGNVPILIMSGLADEDMALCAVQEGAQDYLIKGLGDANLLIRAILYGIERQKLIIELQQAIEKIRTLEGLLPICCYCKNIRDDRGFWHQVEDYIHKHSDARFSHGICPVCAQKNLPHLYKKSESDKKTRS